MLCCVAIISLQPHQLEGPCNRIQGVRPSRPAYPYWYLCSSVGVPQGNPETPFTVTSLVDIGRWTAEALLDPVSK
jgi:hypothetical protein